MPDHPAARACVALIADDTTHNLARALSLTLHRECGTGLIAAFLPPHVSLKQPFEVGAGEMERLDGFLDEFAATLRPRDLTLVGPRYFSFPTAAGEVAIVQLDVLEQEELRAVHYRLNEALGGIVAKPSAAFDGSGYHFHLTLSYGPCPPGMLDRLGEALSGVRVRHPMRAARLDLLLSLDPEGRPGSFVTARSRALGG